MKVIDLLNKIANNEKVPEKIFYKGNVYYQVGDVCFNNLCYENCEIEDSEWKFLCAIENLNDEVEIIEEIEEKEEKKILEKLPKSVTDNACNSKDMRLIANTLNQVIDYLKSKGDK